MNSTFKVGDIVEFKSDRNTWEPFWGFRTRVTEIDDDGDLSIVTIPGIRLPTESSGYSGERGCGVYRVNKVTPEPKRNSL